MEQGSNKDEAERATNMGNGQRTWARVSLQTGKRSGDGKERK